MPEEPETVEIDNIGGVIKHSDDLVKHDMELHCEVCGEHICDVEDGDSLPTLVQTRLAHECPAPVVSVAIELDDDFEPGNYVDNKAEIDEAKEKIRSGEWAAYRIVILEDDERTPYSLGNVVADAGYDNVYAYPEKIDHEYLREHARNLWQEYADQARE